MSVLSSVLVLFGVRLVRRRPFAAKSNSCAPPSNQRRTRHPTDGIKAAAAAAARMVRKTRTYQGARKRRGTRRAAARVASPAFVAAQPRAPPRRSTLPSVRLRGPTRGAARQRRRALSVRRRRAAGSSSPAANARGGRIMREARRKARRRNGRKRRRRKRQRRRPRTAPRQRPKTASSSSSGSSGGGASGGGGPPHRRRHFKLPRLRLRQRRAPEFCRDGRAAAAARGQPPARGSKRVLARKC
jgi:hypothetical protein